MVMTPLTLLILFFGLAFILVGFGLMLGYLIFGRKKEIANRTANRTVVVERDSNLLGTTMAVAGGVIAGELIADAMEDMAEGDVGEEIENVGEAITDAVDDITDFGGF